MTEHSVGNRLARWFIVSALGILAVTATAKVIGAFGDAGMLSQADPVIGMFSNRQAMLLGAVLEVLIMGLVVREHNVVRKAAFVAWISTVFLVYRVELRSIGYKGLCGCLGNMTGTLGIAAATADLISGAILTYLVIGSYSILICGGLSRLAASRGSSLPSEG